MLLNRVSPEEILYKYYGYKSFRKGQKEIIDATLNGKDSLVLMPTGGGKSICFQISALILDGCAIVISPLIALMNDQVLALQASGIPAAAIHSNQDERINILNLDKASKGEIKLIYISPERFVSDIQNIARNIRVSMVAIDEAHCISQWGHDFRPVYTSLKCIKELFPGVPVMALTATADRLTRTDIAEELGLQQPVRYVGSFDRPNLSLEVINDPGKKKRLEIIAELIRKYHDDSGIIYCLSRKKTEAMHQALTDMGFRSVCYHAGLSPKQREEAQKAFVNGEAQVVCATIAFGMGIDKSNIRWVVHNNIPGNIESYYQEIGRAGRDGLPAETILFYNFGDIMMRRNFTENSGHKEINNEKLDFMQRYSESTVCRRRILLSYFSEEITKDCGNCDNCRKVHHKFDGTISAQKALSAVIRINAAEAINTVIDILRASNRSDIIQKGYHLIKTYGAGRDLSSREWYDYILQMIQLGLFEVAYENNFHLRPTPYGMKVIKGEEKIELTTYEPPVYTNKRNKDRAKEIVAKSPEEELMSTLKELRKKIADEAGTPPYTVFSDKTLEEMIKVMPIDIDSFLTISGVGPIKLVKYGKPFISAIRKHKGLKATLPAGSSQKETLALFNAFDDPKVVAQLKNISLETTYSHLIQLAEQGLISDFRKLLSIEDYEKVTEVFSREPENAFSMLVNEYNIPAHIVRAALAEQRIIESNKK